MRVAILHDYLNQFGGAERVLAALLEIFPEADLYTLLYDENKTLGLFKENIRRTSFLDYPWLRNRHRAFIPLMPLAARTMMIDNNYDLIISSSAGYAKGFGHRHNDGYRPFHICYCHTPLRYAWEIDYLKNLPFAPWPLKEFVVRPIAKWLRDWDKESSKKVNVFVANSSYIAEKVKAYYGREAEVVYPPVDSEIFYPDSTTEKKDYFLMVGRLLYYKGFDLGIKVFNTLKKNLKIVGLGPEISKLKKIADPRYIEFIPFLKDEELRKSYSNAKALLFPQIEDFGLVAAEAQLCGLPVLAFNRGGVKEIVEGRKTGLLFEEQNEEAIVRALEDFENLSFDRQYISRMAERFSKENFKTQIHAIIEKCGLK
ncbi:MAG: glycosyltransferase [Patescibacteria group bacterium]|mgnify:FL=1